MYTIVASNGKLPQPSKASLPHRIFWILKFYTNKYSLFCLSLHTHARQLQVVVNGVQADGLARLESRQAKVWASRTSESVA